jgi:two-component system, chemotaxis family, sensor kinase CheA
VSSEGDRDSRQSADTAASDEFVREFLIETREGLDRFDRDVIELGSNPSAADTLPRIFRAIHSIKGASGFLNFKILESVAHAGEGLLSRIRDQRLLPNPEVASTLLDLSDFIRSVLTKIEAEGQEGAAGWHALAKRIDRCQHMDTAATDAAAELPAGAVTLGGSSAQAPEFDAVKPIGQLLVERAGVDPAAVAAARELQRRGDLRTIGEILVAEGVVSPSSARSVIEYQQDARAAATSDSHVRVEITRLDKLIHLVGQLMLVRDEVLHLSQRLPQHNLSSVAQRLDAITNELQYESKQARNQPIGVLFGRLPRLAWDLAQAGGKQLRLQLEGHALELDKLILEEIKDPLMHLVRNSIDHGIETPSRRSAAGKPPEGCLTVRAYRRGDEVRLEVSDDGAGIDLEKVRRAAATKGLLPPDHPKPMSPQQIANLVFLSGLTTAEQVTNISGRGVGMDIVKTNVETLGGTVELQTAMGKGTTVTMRIPLRPESS